MEEAPVRSDERYSSDIRIVLPHFYQAGDSLGLVRRFYQRRKCEMCGGKVDIVRCFELRNARSGKSIICGRKCIVKYAIVLEQMNQPPLVVFPERYRAEAETINRIRPHTVILAPVVFGEAECSEEPEEQELRGEELIEMGLDPDDPAYGELAAEGLDPEDVDWDSFDYE